MSGVEFAKSNLLPAKIADDKENIDDINNNHDEPEHIHHVGSAIEDALEGFHVEHTETHDSRVDKCS
ncbi:hypothetical protein PL8927_550021 [Planktothrix serta PCC 8927]|uniref:Uncharacterized protein n=1 Tax=Planktothrix serta PCC 8927 TaxID=671068 RepID=A0A7Z9DYT7_9CYAN|nr:hypothetical protein PL8927_550021 [Planktothrix serta PCC 8927]